MEQAVRSGQPIPDKIKNAPEVLPGLEFYYVAFCRLSTERQIGMAEGPIPYYAARRFADEYGLDEADFERMWYLVSRLDQEYIRYREKQNKTKGK